MAVQIQAHSFPLHPSVKDRLHPEYVAFYNKHLLNLPPAHCLPLSVSRAGGNAIACHSDPLPVGRVQDICIPQRARQETNGPDIPIRCFTPQGTPPSSGWPLVLYYHGGGWVFGDLSTENNVCTNICNRARAVVITTDYRSATLLSVPRALSDRLTC